MLPVLASLLPIFALILAGWSIRRAGVLGPTATRELNRFVVYLALPALLIDIVANAGWTEIWQPGFVGTFGLGCVAVFVATIAWRLRGARHLADATIDGLNAAYANVGFIGFPLTMAALGPRALAATLIATILTVCVLFALSLVLIEFGLQSEAHPRRLLATVAGSLMRNPLLIAPVLGAVILLCGITLPMPAERFLKLLGDAAAPCALVTLGSFLADKREGSVPVWSTVSLLVALKLIAQPAMTWVLATYVFRLPAASTNAVVLLAALPTGTGPFMLAEFYRREAAITSGAVLVSTILSIVTISVFLSLAI